MVVKGQEQEKVLESWVSHQLGISVMSVIGKLKLPASARGHTHLGEKANYIITFQEWGIQSCLVITWAHRNCALFYLTVCNFNNVNHTLLPEISFSLTFNLSLSPAWLKGSVNFFLNAVNSFLVPILWKCIFPRVLSLSFCYVCLYCSWKIYFVLSLTHSPLISLFTNIMTHT